MRIIEYPTLNSTNLQAARLLSDNEELPFVVFTEHQTNGIGNGDHLWHSEKKQNLTCSFVLNPFVETQYQYLITVATSVSIRLLLMEYIPSIYNIKIKWPNDIYVDDSKISGILITNKILNNCVLSSIIGIGVNLNQTTFPSDIPNPISIKQITGKHIDVKSFMIDLMKIIEANFNNIKNKNIEPLLADYTSSLYKLNEPAEYIVNGVKKEICIRGIDEYGFIV